MKIIINGSQRPTVPQQDRAGHNQRMGDSGTNRDGNDRATGAPTRTTWLRSSGRALRKVAAWFFDRIGYLSG